MKCQQFLVLSVVALVSWSVTGQLCMAATDTDVTELKATSVVITEDKITITAEATVGMVLITPDIQQGEEDRQFTGRPSIWIKIKADEATFTVLRQGKGEKAEDELWATSIKAAEAVKAGKQIGRIGYYRPDVTIKQNKVHEITGKGYLFPRRD